jgi:hypothetical protein
MNHRIRRNNTASRLKNIKKCPLHPRNLPDPLDLSALYEKIAVLWEKTEKTDREQGADIQIRGDHLVLDYEVEGTEQSIQPQDRGQPGDRNHLGFFHTHRLLRGEPMPFSDKDFVAILMAQTQLEVVRSADRVFAVTRTSYSPYRFIVGQKTQNALEKILLRNHLQEVSSEQAYRNANLEICRLYGLAFYTGRIDGKTVELNLETKP